MGGHSHPVFKALRAQKLVQVLPGEPAPPRLTLIPHPGSRFRLRDPGTTRQLCERPGLLREPGGQPPCGGQREGVPPGADPLRRQLAWVRDGGWVLMVVGEAVPLLGEKRGEPEMKWRSRPCWCGERRTAPDMVHSHLGGPRRPGQGDPRAHSVQYSFYKWAQRGRVTWESSHRRRSYD